MKCKIYKLFVSIVFPSAYFLHLSCGCNSVLGFAINPQVIVDFASMKSTCHLESVLAWLHCLIDLCHQNLRSIILETKHKNQAKVTEDSRSPLCLKNYQFLARFIRWSAQLMTIARILEIPRTEERRQQV